MKIRIKLPSLIGSVFIQVRHYCLIMTNSKKTAVFGLGSMGFGIASSLLKEGHDVYGFDVVQAQAERFLEQGGQPGTLQQAAGQIGTVVSVVLNAQQTESILFGEHGIVPLLKPGACVISCATVSPGFARRMENQCAEHQVHYLDAPISGGAAKAAQGKLSVMAAGRPPAFAAAQNTLHAIAETVFELGDEAGPGSAMKAVNQLLAGVHIASMAEALTFGITQGIQPEKMLETISECAGSSWMFENRAPHVVAGDYTPHSAVNIWLKDLGIVLDIAKDAKFSAPLTAAALQQFIAAAGQGLGLEDDAAVAKVYAKNAGIRLPGDD